MKRFNSTIKIPIGVCIGHYCKGQLESSPLANKSKSLCQKCNRFKKASSSNYTIPKRSTKRSKQETEYIKKRNEYLIENPICEVHDCNNISNQVHHKKGRIGDLLTDVRFFMACCGVCHPHRIHDNDEWARKHGYLLNRNK